MAPESPARIPLLERNVNLNAARQLNYERRVNIVDIERAMEQDQDNEEEKEEDDSTSLSSYTLSSNDTMATPSPKLTKAELRIQKREKKSAKSQQKARKNQTKNLVTVTMADVQDVAIILHGSNTASADGSAHPLATDKTIEDVISRNRNFVKSIRVHNAYLFDAVAVGRKEIREKRYIKQREDQGEVLTSTIEMETIISAIMTRLGIDPAVISASLSSSSPRSAFSTPKSYCSSGRKRAQSLAEKTDCTAKTRNNTAVSKSKVTIAVKLRNAIKEDLEKHENEAHMRYVRAGGFWRYVGKTVFDRMTDVARELDVSTGEKWEKKQAREGQDAKGLKDDIRTENCAEA